MMRFGHETGVAMVIPKRNAFFPCVKRPVTAAAVLLIGAVCGFWSPSGIEKVYAASAPDMRPAFPLAVDAGKRYLVDANGKPFLMHGDTAWSLIADLTREEADVYLTDRRKRGFNTILVNLIEKKYARNAPANRYGEAPFPDTDDFSKPNEAYFAHADWVLRRARENGLVVLLTPAYLGYGGGGEGWWREVVRNDLDALRRYGRFLGSRYRGFGNIIWVDSGDYDPPDKKPVQAIVDGIKETDPKALHTAHNGPDTSVADFWNHARWLDVNSVYTYEDVCPRVTIAYQQPKRRPVILIESAYEFEHRATEQRIRRQAYGALLCGASGHVFGNNPIWHFGHKGLFPAPVGWREALGSRGAQSMTHLIGLFSAIPWWTLQPDFNHGLLTAGRGRGHDQAVAGRTRNGALAIVYIPTTRTVSVDLGQLAGPVVSARLYDPSSGQWTKLAGSPFATRGEHHFRPPKKNAAGSGDWVLVLQSRSDAK